MSKNLEAAAAGSVVADLKSGFLVFLIALPLCLGIAMASGFPPVAGIITAIVGGIVVSFLGSAGLTIKGPAAGLIVIAIGAVQELGGGDPVLGYKRALAVGVIAAVLQIILSFVRAASVGIAMAPSVVHGMLAAIGVIIVSKQSHTLMGVVPEAKEPLGLLLEIPKSISIANPEIFTLGLVALVILFGLPMLRVGWAKRLPPPIMVLLVTIPLGFYFDLDHSHNYRMLSHSYHVGPEFLVTLPNSLLGALVMPDFSVIFSGASVKYIIMFALVGTIESTLSVLAVDSMDPRKHTSNLNRDLFATGVGNLIAASIGGLPMISEIVRSKANIDAGATSSRSNFFHGMLLLLSVALIPTLLHEIPLAALAAMLVLTGSRLASLKEIGHAKELGSDQLLLFMTTLFVTLATDLLVGVGVGIALKLVLHWWRGVPLSSLLRTRAAASRTDDDIRIKMYGAAIFTSLLPLRRSLGDVAADVSRVVIDLRGVAVVDHTFLSRVEAMSREWPQAELAFEGLEDLLPVSKHPLATRRRKRA